MKKRMTYKYFKMVMALCLAFVLCAGPVFAAAETGEGEPMVTIEPTKEPTPEPTKEPTPEPTKEPTPEPTKEPTPEPTKEPTPEPTQEPTPEPTKEPTPEPTKEPTPEPTEEPTPEPTEEPTEAPTEEPTEAPTEEPTQEPTEEPTEAPTEEPTQEPTEEPTQEPTEEPTEAPTEEPTQEPTEEPTKAPTEEPSASPEPTLDPEASVSPEPTLDPEASANPEVTPDPEASVSPEPTLDPEATVSPEPSLEPIEVYGAAEIIEGPETILAIDPLNINEVAEVYKKPAIEEVLSLLPTFMTATVERIAEESADNSAADGDDAETAESENVEPTVVPTTVEVPITWTSEGYGDREEGSFIFTSHLPEEGFVLAEGLSMPVFTLVVLETTVYGEYECGMTQQGTVVIVSWSGNAEELVVPEIIKISEGEEAGYTVTGIDTKAFLNHENLKRVELPATVRNIGNKAFEGCKALEKVIVTDTLENVGTDIFLGCEALESFVLRTWQETILVNPDTIEHKAMAMPMIFLAAAISLEEEEMPKPEEEDHTVKMPMAFTNIEVKEESLTVDCDYTLEADHSIKIDGNAILEIAPAKKIINLGTIDNSGDIYNYGTIVNCAGKMTGVEPANLETGVVITKHNYENHVCTVCGDKEEIPITKLTITYNGPGITKTYDKTRNVSLKASDFTVSGVASGHKVKISGITAAYDSAAAGERVVSVGFTLGGADAALYTCDGLKINAVISPKTLTITPSTDQSKIYGDADPAYFTGKVKGLLSGDKLTGRLSREAGESVGKYKIVQGTISGGDNYAVEVVETYFTINARSINSADVFLSTIGNQRYTGNAVEPNVNLSHNQTTLVKDTDYTVTYRDNVLPGTATVTIAGIGNFAESRTASFRILNVSSGVDIGNGSTGDNGETGGNSSGNGNGTSGGGSYGGGFYDDSDADDYNYFDGFEPNDYYFEGEYEGDFDDYEEYEGDFESGEDFPVGSLIVDDEDWGPVLFNELFEPRPFMQVVEAIEEYPNESDASEDDEIGEGYDEAENDTDYEDASEYGWQLRIIPETAYDEEAEDYIYLADGREAYEQLHLRLSAAMIKQLVEREYFRLCYEFEDAVLILPLEAMNGMIAQEGEAGSEMVAVDMYDICLEQVDLDVLSDEESLIKDYTLAANAYRLSISAEKTETDENGMEVVKTFDIIDQLEGLKMRIMPFEEPDEALEKVCLIVGESKTAESTEQLAFPVEYADIDDYIYIDIRPSVSGLYAIIEQTK